MRFISAITSSELEGYLGGLVFMKNMIAQTRSSVTWPKIVRSFQVLFDKFDIFDGSLDANVLPYGASGSTSSTNLPGPYTTIHNGTHRPLSCLSFRVA
jgi:hypothetical protein